MARRKLLSICIPKSKLDHRPVERLLKILLRGKSSYHGNQYLIP